MRCKRSPSRVGLACGALLFSLLATACAGWEPFAPPLQREMREGPGLFSGPDGEFVLERGVPGAAEGGDADGEEEGALRREDERP